MKKRTKGSITVEAAILLPGMILLLCMFAYMCNQLYVNVKLVELAASNADVMTNIDKKLKISTKPFANINDFKIEKLEGKMVKVTFRNKSSVQQAYVYDDFEDTKKKKEGKENDDVWSLPAIERGWELQYIFDRNLPKYFPCIARFDKGVATSIKSIDVTMKSYQSASGLKSNIEKFAKELKAFNGGEKDGIEIKAGEIKKKVLKIIIPKNVITEEQRKVIKELQAKYNDELKIELCEYGEKRGTENEED